MKRIISLILSALMVISVCGCAKSTGNLQSGGNNIQGEKWEPYYNIPEDYVIPQYNGQVITGIDEISSCQPMAMDTATRKIGDSYTKPSEKLREAVILNDGKDVWFRIRLSYYYFDQYDEQYEGNKEIPNYRDSQEYKQFQSERLEYEKNYAKAIGAQNIIENPNTTSDALSGAIMMEITAQMLEMIVERGTAFRIHLAPPDRVEGYNDKISDYLTNKLSTMDNDDTTEVICVTVADRYNCYAGEQYPSSADFKQELYKEIPKNNMDEKEYEGVLEKYIVDIIKRNNILEKRVIDKVVLTPDYPQPEPRIPKNGSTCLAHDLSKAGYKVGFNANLSKAEILALANDADIKAIYPYLPKE